LAFRGITHMYSFPDEDIYQPRANIAYGSAL
jgi:hypothetical protein